MANKRKMNVTTNGCDVYSIVNNEHMLAHASVQEKHLEEAIARIELRPPFGFYTVDLDHVVGATACVKTDDSDDVRIECRPGRDLPSRLVYDRKPEETSLLTVGICTDDDGLETVFTAFYGELAPKELSDPRLTDEERPDAEAFWSTHALVAEC